MNLLGITDCTVSEVDNVYADVTGQICISYCLICTAGTY